VRRGGKGGRDEEGWGESGAGERTGRRRVEVIREVMVPKALVFFLFNKSAGQNFVPDC